LRASTPKFRDMNYEIRYAMLKDIIEKRKATAESKKKDLEDLIWQGVATSTQKQNYIELKAKIETYEEVLDYTESLSKEE